MLTKTQLELIARAERNRDGIVAIETGFITSRRLNRRYGQREWKAMRKLVEAGKFRWVSSHKSVTHLCHGFGADHGTSHIYQMVVL